MCGVDKAGFSVKDLTQAGVMVAVIEVSKVLLSSIPNAELTSFWLIMFTLCFGWRIVMVVPTFIMIEGALYGISLWWVMYLYAWPLLVLVVWIFRRNTSALFWAIVSGIFGLMFGLLCSIPYFAIGAASGGAAAGLRAAFVWWTAGIPWDIVHCICNFTLMLVLFHPVGRVMRIIKQRSD